MPSIFSLIPSDDIKGVSISLPTGTRVVGDLAKLEEINALRIDASLIQRHTSTIEVTRNPVETGFEVTDHIDQKPREFFVKGVITNTPIRLLDAAVTSVAGIGGRLFTQANNLNPRLSSALTAGISSAASGIAGQAFGTSTTNRVQTAVQILEAIQDNNTLITVTTRLRTYENMALTNLRIELDKSNGSTLPFSATMVEVRVVRLKILKLPKGLIDESINSSASGKTALGNQSTNPASAAETAKKNDSIAFGLANPGA